MKKFNVKFLKNDGRIEEKVYKSFNERVLEHQLKKEVQASIMASSVLIDIDIEEPCYVAFSIEEIDNVSA